MDLSLSTGSCCSFSGSALYSPSIPSFRSKRFLRRLNCNPKPARVQFSPENDGASLLMDKFGRCSRDNLRDKDDNVDASCFVDVVGIGSRTDAVLDFCLNSPSRSQTLRFWNIILADSNKVQLQQKFLGIESSARIVDAESIFRSRSVAVILLAGSAYGSDHLTVLNMLKQVKSSDKLVAGIILKPFSFEGRRRQEEVKDIGNEFQKHTTFCFFIDTDVLLEKHPLTLDEAMRTANNAILMATNAIPLLVSDACLKLLDVALHGMKEVKVPELVKILESYKDARIGFGSGANIKASIISAIYDCPFLDFGEMQFNGVVICIIESAGATKSSDVHVILKTFRQATDWKGDILISVIHKDDLEPDLIVASIITFGCTRQKSPQKSSIFARLAHQFPLIFNFLGNHQLPSDNRDNELGSKERENGPSDSSPSCSQNFEGEHMSILERKQLSVRNLGNGYQTAEDWNNEGPDSSLSASILDSPNIFTLPVGVKPSEYIKDSPSVSSTTYHTEKRNDNDMRAKPQFDSNSSWNTSTAGGFEALIDNISTTSLKQNNSAFFKQRILASRAASMLDADRGLRKRWDPVLEMKYRGGIYKGHCQGGLPEGKGQLSVADGSLYDGMWHHGKRSGLGALYFHNGDVFQGSWRDDVMHGKGWFYFHTGDRWFVNFWKGKAHGEGRFYSKLGDIFFGHFKDGWRDGQFICISVCGTRFIEMWADGVLVNHEQLERDAGS